MNKAVSINRIRTAAIGGPFAPYRSAPVDL